MRALAPAVSGVRGAAGGYQPLTMFGNLAGMAEWTLRNPGGDHRGNGLAAWRRAGTVGSRLTPGPAAGCVAAFLLAGSLLAGCSIGATERVAAPVCRASASEPGVEVCQDGGRISVVAAHGREVDAESIALEGIDVAALPRAASPTVEVVASEIFACAAAPTGDGAVEAGAAAVECRIRLLMRHAAPAAP